MLDQVTPRAQILVKAYREMFPDRPESEPLSREEIIALSEKVTDQLFGKGSARLIQAAKDGNLQGIEASLTAVADGDIIYRGDGY